MDLLKTSLFKKFFAEWENDRYTIRFYQVITLSLIIALLVSISGIIYTSQNTRTILVPTSLEKTVWVAGKDASDEYYSDMAMQFANFRLTFSPLTAEFQFKYLLKYVTPQAFSVLSSELAVLATDIKGKNYAQVFYPTSVEATDREKHVFTLQGSERHFIGSQQVEEVGKEYLIQFQVQNGKIFVSSFKDAKVQKVSSVTAPH